MKYRKLGRTGLNVSEIGFGAWGISGAQWIGAEDEVSVQTLKAARDAGINFFDTALAYGDGHSEQLMNRAFGKSPEVIIASKVPPKNLTWPARKGSALRDVFPKDYVLKSLDQTLKNLGRDYVDVYQFHVWTDEWASENEWLETARQMRESGKTRFVGISINDHQPTNVLRALDSSLVDAVQVIYNIFDQTPADELYPYCQKHDIGVIARVPLDEGTLTGTIRPETTFPKGDFRNDYLDEKRRTEAWTRVQQIAADTGTPIEKMPELALRFCMSDPAVSTVIPGMRTPKRVAVNVAVSDAGPLPAETLKKLESHRWVSW